MSKPDRDEGLRAAIAVAGGISALARKLGMSAQALWEWRRAPADRIIQVEAVTGIDRARLSPELYENSEFYESDKEAATMTVHDLKSWPDFFGPIFDGSKTFELRNDDRGYRVGDLLHLREWDDKTGRYTGRECFRRVTYILDGNLAPHRGLARGYCCMSLAPSDGGSATMG